MNFISLKKLDSYELECVAAGVPGVAFRVAGLGLYGFTGLVVEELTGSTIAGTVVGLLTGALVPLVLEGSTRDLFKKVWEAFRAENPEPAEAAEPAAIGNGVVALEN